MNWPIQFAWEVIWELISSHITSTTVNGQTAELGISVLFIFQTPDAEQLTSLTQLHFFNGSPSFGAKGHNAEHMFVFVLTSATHTGCLVTRNESACTLIKNPLLVCCGH